MDNKNNTQSLATPLAIIVAGFMIASAIYVSNSQSGFLKSKNATNSAGVVANANGGAGTDQNGQAIQPGEVPQPSPTPDPTVAPEEGGIYKVSIDDDPVLGDPNAPVTMIAFSDFRCPFCERFATDAFVKIKKDYVDTGKVKYILRDFSIHPPQSDDAALGAQCANEQGKFWEYHDMLFVKLTAGEDFSAVNLKKYAGTLGLNQSTFDSCLDGGKYKDEIGKDKAEGVEASVSGTPTLFVGKSDASGTIEGVKIVGAQPYETFAAEINKLLP